MKVKKIFHASCGLIGTTRLYTLPSPVHIATAHKWIHTALHTMCPLPSIFLDPTLLAVYHVHTSWTETIKQVGTAHARTTILAVNIKDDDIVATCKNHQTLHVAAQHCYQIHM